MLEKYLQPGDESQITPEDLRAQSDFQSALDNVLSIHSEAVEFVDPDRGDRNGYSGGERLTLYPDPDSPRSKITISPVGRTAEDRRFPADSLHIVYKGGGKAEGTYRIHNQEGTWAVERWEPHPQIQGAIIPTLPRADTYLTFTEALGVATTERPTSQFRKRVSRLIGSRSRQA